jgi:hypothetical protein
VYAVAAYVCTRVLIFVVAYAAPQHRDRPGTPSVWPDTPLIRWDAGHYLYIMQHGYPSDNPKSDAIAFFPAYPLLARPLARWMSDEVALVVTNNVASFVGILFFHAWCRKRTDGRTAFWCILLFSVYPLSMFLSAGYADGLLFLCVAVIFCLLERQRVYTAACFSALATATRPTGLPVAAVVLMWTFVHGPRGSWMRRLIRLVPIGIISVSGLMAFQVYLWHRYHRPDAFFAVQSNWGRPRESGHPALRMLALKPVTEPVLRVFKCLVRGDFKRLFDPMRVWNHLFNLAIVLLAAHGLARSTTIPRLLFLLPILVFLMAYLMDPVDGRRLQGIARYQLIALPSFLWLAQMALTRWNRFAKHALLMGLVSLQCMYVWKFVDLILVG